MYTQRNMLGPCEGMMRFWPWVFVWVMGLAGPAAAMTCFVAPNAPGFVPKNPFASQVLNVTGIPNSESSFLAFGTLVPTHTQPLLHEELTDLLEKRWQLESGSSYETSDTDMEFFYRAHFEFSGIFFDGQGWVGSDGDTTQVSLILMGEGGYHGRIPEGPNYMLLTRDSNASVWYFDAGLCPKSVAIESTINAEVQAELASCLPSGTCLD